MTTLRDGFNALEASEAVAALLLTYYLEESAKTLYASQRSSGVRSEAGALAGTWPDLIHELIKRYLIDDVLQSAYEQVTDARQKSNEDENEFADRIAKAAREYCNVFRDRELFNYFIRGMLPATHDCLNHMRAEWSLCVGFKKKIAFADYLALHDNTDGRARTAFDVCSVPSRDKCTRL